MLRDLSPAAVYATDILYARYFRDVVLRHALPRCHPYFARHASRHAYVLHAARLCYALFARSFTSDAMHAQAVVALLYMQRAYAAMSAETQQEVTTSTRVMILICAYMMSALCVVVLLMRDIPHVRACRLWYCFRAMLLREQRYAVATPLIRYVIFRACFIMFV